MELVPTIDIANPGASSLAALDRACRDHGFFLIAGHGLDPLIAETFAAAKRFFDADPQTKDGVRRDASNPLGYNERELTKQKRDHKEVFDFMDPASSRGERYNRWPADMPAFRAAMERHYDAFSALAARTTELVFAALGQSGDVAALHHGDRTMSSMRLNHYTLDDPVPEAERGDLASLGDVALGQHTDSGLLTLLIQDGVGGLQAFSDQHGWVDVEPQDGTIVVNIADCLQVLTNDQYKAALHRVVEMTVSTRMSLPYFSNPARDAVIEPVEALCDGHPRYRSFVFRDFIAARAADNYADSGAPDAQISDYRID